MHPYGFVLPTVLYQGLGHVVRRLRAYFVCLLASDLFSLLQVRLYISWLRPVVLRRSHCTFLDIFVSFTFYLLLLTQIYQFHLATDGKMKPKKTTTTIPPACRSAGVLTASELRIEESILMDCDHTTIPDSQEKETNNKKEPPAASSSEDEDRIPPYQKRRKETKDTSPGSTEIPNHLFEDLCGHWRSHSYYMSRVRIFQGFATDGPFPSLTSFQFREDPHTGLTRKCSAELDEATQNFKERICEIHAKNYTSLATNELTKINALMSEAGEIFDETKLRETLQEAKKHAFNKAREIRRRKNQNKQKEKNASKRKRSPSRGRSRERR